jgi:hypothetical protein
MNTSLPVTLGVANGQTIIVNVSPADFTAPLRTVTLSASYDRNPLPGWLWALIGVEVAKNTLAGAPITIPPGTAITVTAPEAAALIDAGAAN